VKNFYIGKHFLQLHSKGSHSFLLLCVLGKTLRNRVRCIHTVVGRDVYIS